MKRISFFFRFIKVSMKFYEFLFICLFLLEMGKGGEGRDMHTE